MRAWAFSMESRGHAKKVKCSETKQTDIFIDTYIAKIETWKTTAMKNGLKLRQNSVHANDSKSYASIAYSLVVTYIYLGPVVRSPFSLNGG